jgi:hypothetical protein
MKKLSEWAQKAARGETKPEIIFRDWDIAIFNRLHWPLGTVPYDDGLKALAKQGRQLEQRWLFLGRTPEFTRKHLIRHKCPVPVEEIADWQKFSDGLRAFDPSGREVYLQGWGKYPAAFDIWSGDIPLCFGGYKGVWFESRGQVLAVANELALGRSVPGFHWPGEQHVLSATTLRISMIILTDENKRGGGALNDKFRRRTRLALRDATYALVFMVAKEASKAEAVNAVDALADVYFDAQEAGLDFPSYSADAQSWVAELLQGQGVPKEHAKFFAYAPVEWLTRSLMLMVGGKERIRQREEVMGHVFNARATAAIDWVYDELPS